MIRATHRLGLCGLLAVASLGVIDTARLEAADRQYYGSWTYNPVQTYHYRTYNYYPTPAATTYSYHYVIYYPTQPRYYYYYNPVSRQYWGRYDLEAKGYSLLAEGDRKEKLEDIKEEAFPKPGKLPPIPESKDDVSITAPPNDAPKGKPEKK